MRDEGSDDQQPLMSIVPQEHQIIVTASNETLLGCGQKGRMFGAVGDSDSVAERSWRDAMRDPPGLCNASNDQLPRLIDRVRPVISYVLIIIGPAQQGVQIQTWYALVGHQQLMGPNIGVDVSRPAAENNAMLSS